MNDINISCLVGQVLTECSLNENKDRISFVTKGGDEYVLYHEQDCCESVFVEDINGNLQDLIGEPILVAEETSNGEVPDKEDGYYGESFTWTFYRLATKKGYVVIRWYGESNGYYSESVDFCKL